MQLCFVSAIYTFLSFKARRAIFLAGFLSNSIVADVISSEVHVLSR